MILFQVSDNCHALSDSHLKSCVEEVQAPSYFTDGVGCQLLVTFPRTLTGVEFGGAGAGLRAHSLSPQLSLTFTSAPADGVLFSHLFSSQYSQESGKG